MCSIGTRPNRDGQAITHSACMHACMHGIGRSKTADKRTNERTKKRKIATWDRSRSIVRMLEKPRTKLKRAGKTGSYSGSSTVHMPMQSVLLLLLLLQQYSSSTASVWDHPSLFVRISAYLSIGFQLGRNIAPYLSTEQLESWLP